MMPFRNMAKIRRLLNMIKILWRLGLEQFYVQTWCNFRNKAQFFSSLKKKCVRIISSTHIVPETVMHSGVK